ncbi:LysM domain protein, partial [Coprococcus eutactus]|nr:LysM domain protein [Coprococcus eutactus]
SSDDSRPLWQMEIAAQFTYRRETVELRSQDSIRITPALSQISASLPGNDEVEIKSILDIGITIFTRKEI